MKTKTLKTILASAILFSVLIPAVSAQDTLYLKDGSKLEVRIGDITDTKIEFRKYGSTDLDFYYIDRMDALKIHYDNGDVRNFGEKERVVIKRVTEKATNQSSDLQLLGLRRGSFCFVSEDGAILKRKIKNREMKTLLHNNIAMDYYKSYRTFRAGTVIFASLTAAIAIGTLGIHISDLKHDDYNDYTGYYALMGVSFLSELGCAIARDVFKKKVVKSYNGYVRKEYDRYSLNFGATKHGLGLVLKF